MLVLRLRLPGKRARIAQALKDVLHARSVRSSLLLFAFSVPLRAFRFASLTHAAAAANALG